MDKQATQFWVAIIAVAFVGLINVLLVFGAIFKGVDLATAMAAFAGLTSIAGTAVAWLFRVNHTQKPPP